VPKPHEQIRELPPFFVIVADKLLSGAVRGGREGGNGGRPNSRKGASRLGSYAELTVRAAGGCSDGEKGESKAGLLTLSLIFLGRERLRTAITCGRIPSCRGGEGGGGMEICLGWGETGVPAALGGGWRGEGAGGKLGVVGVSGVFPLMDRERK